jgi:hypothetical protein
MVGSPIHSTFVGSDRMGEGDDSFMKAVSVKAVSRILSIRLHEAHNSRDDIGDNHSA